jgi:hypothetical protein
MMGGVASLLQVRTKLEQAVPVGLLLTNQHVCVSCGLSADAAVVDCPAYVQRQFSVGEPGVACGAGSVVFHTTIPGASLVETSAKKGHHVTTIGGIFRKSEPKNQHKKSGNQYGAT